MGQLQYAKFETILLKSNPEYNELWVQDKIADDPSILGLGDLVVRGKERIHAGAGRLDLLLEDRDSGRRFEVEIQLGKTDEQHIVRTVEYWDIERKRFPKLQHTAVIVAEEITGRFHNVIGLFNGSIPIIAIQMRALKSGQQISLVFTKVLDETRFAQIDEEEEIPVVTDRAYWEARGSKTTLAMADELLEIVHEFDSQLALKYNKLYIGLAKDGQPSNFIILKPKKESLRLEPRLDRSDELTVALENAGLEVMDYDTRWGRYRIRLGKGDVKKHEDMLRSVVQQAYRNAYD